MEKSAVEHIQVSANIPAIIEQAESTEIPVAIIPESMAIESLEKYMASASRYRLNFETTSITEFIEYGELCDIDGAMCFVDAEAMTAKSIIDLGTHGNPGHQEHTASLRMKMTAAYRAIAGVSGDRLSQKEAAEFLEDWADFMAIATKDGDAMTIGQASASLRTLTIEGVKEVSSSVGDFGESMGAMERIEAKNKESIPSEIRFSCEPYGGLASRDINVRVSLAVGRDKPEIIFRIIQKEALDEELAEEFKDILVDASEGLKLITLIGKV